MKKDVDAAARHHHHSFQLTRHTSQVSILLPAKDLGRFGLPWKEKGPMFTPAMDSSREGRREGEEKLGWGKLRPICSRNISKTKKK